MLTTFNITQTGKNHIAAQKPCQDYSETMRIHAGTPAQDLVISAVSDGVGSCLYSQNGSREAVKAALKTVSLGLNAKDAKVSDAYVSALLQKAFDDAYDAVLACADEHEYPFSQLDCTLTVSVYDGTTIWFGHIGDDGIVAMYTDGTYEMITQRHKGDYVSSVHPLRETEKWQFGKSPKPAASFALMTDGVLDYVVGSEFCDSRVFYPFIQPVLAAAMDDNEQTEHLKQEFAAYLADDPADPSGFRKNVSDDITIAVVQNSEAVHRLPDIRFDMDEWDRQTEEYRKKAEESLYKAAVTIDVSADPQPAADETKSSRTAGEPLVIDPDEETTVSDSLDILPLHSVKNTYSKRPSAVQDETAEDLQKAAEQVIADLMETGSETAKALLKVGNSVKSLSFAIIRGMQNRTKE